MFFKNESINFEQIKACVFDVDGVFSGNMIMHPSGDMMRTMNAKDGLAVRLAIDNGLRIAIITGGNSPSVKMRFELLGVTDIYMPSYQKWDDFKDFITKHNIKPEQVLYMGDDIPDYEVMFQVGFPCCPCDAVDEIKAVSRYISPYKGGDGCVRDVLEKVLKAQNLWSVNKNIKP